MPIRKYGTGDGEVLPEDGEEQKTAKKSWTEQDEQELHEELKD